MYWMSFFWVSDFVYALSGPFPSEPLPCVSCLRFFPARTEHMTRESPGWDPPISTLPVGGSSCVFIRCVFDRF